MNYHNITYPDMNNGDGLRVVLWLSGCSHHCYNCQNPQTWNENNGILFDAQAENELIKEFDNNYISGMTFTGGDPLMGKNLCDVLKLIVKIRSKYQQQKTIWLYTGYTWEEIWDQSIHYQFNTQENLKLGRWKKAKYRIHV